MRVPRVCVGRQRPARDPRVAARQPRRRGRRQGPGRPRPRRDAQGKERARPAPRRPPQPPAGRQRRRRPALPGPARRRPRWSRWLAGRPRRCPWGPSPGRARRRQVKREERGRCREREESRGDAISCCSNRRASDLVLGGGLGEARSAQRCAPLRLQARSRRSNGGGRRDLAAYAVHDPNVHIKARAAGLARWGSDECLSSRSGIRSGLSRST